MPTKGWDCAGIVFSKDRPLQLHALLHSYLHHCRPPPRLEVLYTASSPAYLAAYEEVMTLFPDAAIGWHRECDFAADVRALIAGLRTQGVFFLVDDMVFIRPVGFPALAVWPLERYIPSLRLGRNITWSHFAGAPRRQPSLESVADGLLTWRVAEAHAEWRLISFDGDIFLRAELEAMAGAVTFSSPNKFELALAIFLPALSLRRGLCFEQSRVVNLPLNRVQREFANPAGGLHPDTLLDYWQHGLCLDVDGLYNAQTSSIHEELPIRFVPRSTSALRASAVTYPAETQLVGRNGASCDGV